MGKTVKFAVSFPSIEYKELETLRKKERLSRSGFIREAFKLWKEKKKDEKLIKIYEEGYKKVPENLTNIEAWERVSLSSFSREEW